MLLTKTFVCLPDGTVVSGKSKKLRRLAQLEAPPEVLAVTVTAGEAGGSMHICGCEASRVVPVSGEVLLRRSYDRKVVPLPGTGPVLDVDAYQRLIGVIGGAFGHEAVMEAYHQVIRPALLPYCGQEVLETPHLGPCLEVTEPDEVLEALSRHADTPVFVALSDCNGEEGVLLSHYLMRFDSAEIRQLPGGYVLYLFGEALTRPGGDGKRMRLLGQNLVSLPYRPDKLSAFVYPDGLTVYSYAAGLMLDLTDAPACRAVPASQCVPM